LKTKGILLAGGKGTRLAPSTTVLNKHLLPVYDKPMIYYALSTLMHCGLREIAIVTNRQDVEIFRKLLGDGSNFGINLDFLIQDEPRGLPDAFRVTAEYLGESNSVLALGDNIFTGPGFGQNLRNSLTDSGASIFAIPVNNPSEYGVIEFNTQGEAVSIEEKPRQPKSQFAIPGLYFLDNNAVEYSQNLSPSQRGELEIIDLLSKYLKAGTLKVNQLKRGSGWLDAGTTENLFAASELVRVYQVRHGLRIAVPEEIAYNNGWISDSDIWELALKYEKTEYGEYLRNISQIK
jgi:glucose-1-phosphate thymidylyltransferase